MKIRLLAIALTFALEEEAAAQILIQADLVALQPTISRDSSGFSACGVRAIVTVAVGKQADVYDFSVNAYAKSFVGLIKAGKYRASYPLKLGQSLPSVFFPAPVNFWIAAIDQGAPTSPSKFTAAESKGFILGAVPIEMAFKNILDMAYGRKVQFAIRYPDEKVDKAITFRKNMDDDEREALQLCMDGLIARFGFESDNSKK